MRPTEVGIGISDPYTSQSRGGLCEDVRTRDRRVSTESAGVRERTRGIEKRKKRNKAQRYKKAIYKKNK